MPSPGQALAAGRRRPLGRALPGFGTQPHCASKIGGWLPSGSSPASHSFLSAGNATNQPQNTSASAIAPRSAPTALPLPLPALSTALREAVAGRTSKSLSESRSKSVLTLNCGVRSCLGDRAESVEPTKGFSQHRGLRIPNAFGATIRFDRRDNLGSPLRDQTVDDRPVAEFAGTRS
jgi:hypothetical protein